MWIMTNLCVSYYIASINYWIIYLQGVAAGGGKKGKKNKVLDSWCV